MGASATHSWLHPMLREEQTHRLLAQLTAGQIDLAMVAIRVPGDLTTAPIAHESFVVAAPRGAKLVSKRGKVTQADLDHVTMLLLDGGHCLRDQALAGSRGGPRPRVCESFGCSPRRCARRQIGSSRDFAGSSTFVGTLRPA